VGSPRLAVYDLLLWQTELEAIELVRRGGDIEAAAPLVGMVGALALETPEYHARATPRETFSKLVAQAKAGGMDHMHDQRVQSRR
jgi:hypothetical protein